MAVKENIFDPQTIDQTSYALTQHMPDGDAWEAKAIEGTNLNGLVYGVSSPYHIFRELVNYVQKQFDIEQTTDLISEWEESCGLPDSCTGHISGIDARRVAVIRRFRRRPIVTLSEMQNYINSLFPDAEITLIPGTDFLTFEYDLPVTYIGEINERFVLVVQIKSPEPLFEYDFEVEFTAATDTDALLCILRKVAPSNVALLLDEV